MVWRLLAAASVVLAAEPVLPCSLSAGYLKPSNYELVRATPRIVLARAVSAVPGHADPTLGISAVKFEVKEVLKGATSEKTLTLLAERGYDGPGDLSTFRMPRPGAGRGACNANDYRIGTSYLLFLPERDGAALDWLSGPPFSRINEEAFEGSPWLTAVRHYVRIAALPDAAARKRALRELQSRRVDMAEAQQLPQAMRDDIADHFETPSPRMSYEDLLAFYRRKDEDLRIRALLAMAQAPKPEARALFEERLRNGTWRSDAHATLRFIANTRDSGLASQLLAKLPGTRDRALRWAMLHTLADAASADAQPRMLLALRQASEAEREILEPWFARQPSARAQSKEAAR